MQYFLETDSGLVRKNNEDYIFFDELHNIFIIADGMGGHNAGEVASKMAVQSFVEFLNKLEKFNVIEMLNAISYCNTSVYKASLKNKSYKGMGTTFTACHVDENIVNIIHIGDTRAYKITKESIIQITEDHTLVQELFKQKKITEKEMINHPNSHILFKALGTKNSIFPSVYSEKFEEDSFLLMTSDGLTDLINDEEIREIVNKIDVPQSIVENLIATAIEKGGNDNISIICVKFGQEKESLK
ncbi:MAG: Stp1/IreP family PP2C-type Ser/Thr phosphatase [Clostridiales bacterium]|nr:Stp1/IreP family PP2C-type Ser/Thr phosphatase [Clostridiales bacterium]